MRSREATSRASSACDSCGEGQRPHHTAIYHVPAGGALTAATLDGPSIGDTRRAQLAGLKEAAALQRAGAARPATQAGMPTPLGSTNLSLLATGALPWTWAASFLQSRLERRPSARSGP